MAYSKQEFGQGFQKYYTEFTQLGLALDLSRMDFSDEFLGSTHSAKPSDAMEALEKGAMDNPDENRMAGHYWLCKAETFYNR